MSVTLEGDSSNPTVPGVKGTNSAAGNGVYGTSTASDAVVGLANAQGKAGVLGLAPNGNAVAGISDPVNGNGTGVFGEGKVSGGSFISPQVGILANGVAGYALKGTSAQSDGVVGVANAKGKAGVLGLAPDGNAVAGISTNQTGIYGQGGQYAGYFQGNVAVTGDIQLTGGADCAEQFDILDVTACDPGTVMVINDTGALMRSQEEYDHRVAGVVSGAGDLRPVILLDDQPDIEGRRPIALIGKVFCKAIADGKAIEVGDLLTTSSVAGHAMKATDPLRGFGAVIGKALQPLPAGTGLIRILITRQ